MLPQPHILHPHFLIRFDALHLSVKSFRVLSRRDGRIHVLDYCLQVISNVSDIPLCIDHNLCRFILEQNLKDFITAVPESVDGTEFSIRIVVANEDYEALFQLLVILPLLQKPNVNHSLAEVSTFPKITLVLSRDF